MALVALRPYEIARGRLRAKNEVAFVPLNAMHS